MSLLELFCNVDGFCQAIVGEVFADRGDVLPLLLKTFGIPLITQFQNYVPHTVRIMPGLYVI